MSKLDLLTDIFLQHKFAIKSIVRKIVPQDEVDDIVQETYIKTINFGQSNEIKKPYSFICTTAKNLALDYVRSARVRLNDPIEAQDFSSEEDPIFDQFIIEQELQLQLEAISKLPPQCKKIFILKKVYGFSQKEISEQLGISPRTVEKQISKGIKKIRGNRSAKPTRTQLRQKTYACSTNELVFIKSDNLQANIQTL